MILAYETRVVGRLAQSSLGLLPIAPIILLPFIIIFFVVVFPIWGVSLGVVGLVLLIMRGLKWLANKAGSTALDGATGAVHHAFRWVLTWAGLTERFKQRTQRT